jgi:hypothetical protein
MNFPKRKLAIILILGFGFYNLTLSKSKNHNLDNKTKHKVIKMMKKEPYEKTANFLNKNDIVKTKKSGDENKKETIGQEKSSIEEDYDILERYEFSHKKFGKNNFKIATNLRATFKKYYNPSLGKKIKDHLGFVVYEINEPLRQDDILKIKGKSYPFGHNDISKAMGIVTGNINVFSKISGGLNDVIKKFKLVKIYEDLSINYYKFSVPKETNMLDVKEAFEYLNNVENTTIEFYSHKVSLH